MQDCSVCADAVGVSTVDEGAIDLDPSEYEPEWFCQVIPVDSMTCVYDDEKEADGGPFDLGISEEWFCQVIRMLTSTSGNDDEKDSSRIDSSSYDIEEVDMSNEEIIALWSSSPL